MRAAISLVLAVVIAFIPAMIGAGSRPDGWYESLNKPTWNPPSWVFGPVWTALYLSMGVASWLVWRRGQQRGPGDQPALRTPGTPTTPSTRAPLAAYAVQLVLNALWSPLFFGLHRPDLALIDIALLWVAILATLILFWRVRPLAGAMLLPYLAWVSFAAVLNWTLWRLNPDA
jgi:benzodiazapine receptor